MTSLPVVTVEAPNPGLDISKTIVAEKVTCLNSKLMFLETATVTLTNFTSDKDFTATEINLVIVTWERKR